MIDRLYNDYYLVLSKNIAQKSYVCYYREGKTSLVVFTVREMVDGSFSCIFANSFDKVQVQHGKYTFSSLNDRSDESLMTSFFHAQLKAISFGLDADKVMDLDITELIDEPI